MEEGELRTPDGLGGSPRRLRSLSSSKALLVVALVALVTVPRAQTLQNTYKAAVVEFSPALGVTLDNIEKRFSENIAAYAQYAKKAKNEGADIIVFPECGLATLELPRLPPESRPAVSLQLPPVGTNPCGDTARPYAQNLRDLACAADKSNIYMVVNLPEEEECQPSVPCPYCGHHDDPIVCPTTGRHFFNTDVVFGRDGSIIAKYRKYNLFGEAGFSAPERPDYTIFQTDFGETFGVFTCFDLMFKSPAVDLVRAMGVRNVIFPTAWFSELPFLTAAQAQAAWARALDVNFLAAGYNLPSVGSTGSGLYAGAYGAVVAVMEEEPANRLLVGELPRRATDGEVKGDLEGRVIMMRRKDDEVPVVHSPTVKETAIYEVNEKPESMTCTCKPEKRSDSKEGDEAKGGELWCMCSQGSDSKTPDNRPERPQCGCTPGNLCDDKGEVCKEKLEEDEKGPSAEELASIPLFLDEPAEPLLEIIVVAAEVEVKDDAVPEVQKQTEEGGKDYTSGGMPPQAEEMPPQTEEMPPQAEEMPPQAEEMPPQAEETPPQLEVVLPPVDDTSPEVAGLVDPCQANVPRFVDKPQGEVEDALPPTHDESPEVAGLVDPCQAGVPVFVDEPQEAVVDVSKEDEVKIEDVPEEKQTEGGGEELVWKDMTPPAEETPAELEDEEEVTLPPVQGFDWESSEETAEKEDVMPPEVSEALDEILEVSTETGGEEIESTKEEEIIHVEPEKVTGLFLKTEDLSQYVSVLIATEELYENSTVFVCHCGFCCHFQFTVIVGRSTAEALGVSVEIEKKKVSKVGEKKRKKSKGKKKSKSASKDTGDILVDRSDTASGRRFTDSLMKVISQQAEQKDEEIDEEDMSAYEPDKGHEEGLEIGLDLVGRAVEEEQAVAADIAMGDVQKRAEALLELMFGDEEEEEEFDEDAEEFVMPEKGEETHDLEEEDMMPSEFHERDTEEYGDHMEDFGEEEEEEEEYESGGEDYESLAPKSEHVQAKSPEATKPVRAVTDTARCNPDTGTCLPDIVPTHPDIVPETPEIAPVKCEKGEDGTCASAGRKEEPTRPQYYYRVAVFQGQRSFDDVAEGGLQVCSFIACTDPLSLDSCGKLIREDVDMSAIYFRNISIWGNFRKDNGIQLPSTLGRDLLPLPGNAYEFEAEETEDKEFHTVRMAAGDLTFLTFGIYGRDFSADNNLFVPLQTLVPDADVEQPESDTDL